MLFLGTIENKLDQKGRISVPADFRMVVKNSTFQGIILFHSFTNKCIEGCSMERMEMLSDATDNLDLFSEENDNLNSLIFSDARQLSFDVTGRIVIPSDLLEFAGIKNSALFVGKGKTFQIWNPDEFNKFQNNVRKKAFDARPSLSFKKE